MRRSFQKDLSHQDKKELLSLSLGLGACIFLAHLPADRGACT